MTETALVEGLLNPEAYPWRPAVVELVETHVSWVFLTGERVVKVKKPVSYGFVDHTALESRRRSCEDEVRLNRRLTGGVYLGVVPIVRAPAGYRVDAKGTPVEWATLMRRLPAEGMLDALLAAGEIPPHLGDRLADRLIPFHRDGAAFCEGRADEVAAATSAVVTENLAELEPFANEPLGPAQLGLVAEALRGIIAEHGDVLRDRAAAGWIREGHGDLRVEHVCLEGTRRRDPDLRLRRVQPRFALRRRGERPRFFAHGPRTPRSTGSGCHSRRPLPGGWGGSARRAAPPLQGAPGTGQGKGRLPYQARLCR